MCDFFSTFDTFNYKVNNFYTNNFKYDSIAINYLKDG